MMTSVAINSLRLVLTATLALLAVSCAALAQTRHALLVGVSDYGPSVSQLAPRLNGPGNDVALMHDLVSEAGFEEANVAILTDRADLLAPAHRVSATRPTRRAILEALERLVERASKGDDILIYFAGHGAQLPDQAGDAFDDEPDGFDEVFLPSDFEILNQDGARQTSNAIRDDEIGTFIDTLLARGAHVWLIADTCHAGTLRRTDGQGLVPRQLTLTDAAPAQTDRRADPAAGLAEPRQIVGQFVAFYGAAAGDLAYETEVRGTDQPDEGVVHGVLTWALARAIREGAQDYRDLARLTRSAVWTASAGRADPAFSGVLGGRPMLGAARASTLRAQVQLLDDTLVLGAGLLEGLKDGMTMDLTWTTPKGQIVPLARGTVTQTGLSSAAILLSEAGSIETTGLDRQITSDGLDPGMDRLRWLQGRAPGLSASPSGPNLLQSHPFVSFEDDGSAGDLAERVSAVLLGVPQATTDAREQDRFSIRLEAAGARLRLSYREAQFDKVVPATNAGLDTLQAQIARMHRARQLQAVAELLSHRDLSKTLLADVTIEPSRDAECAPAQRGPAQGPPFVVHHCDLVTIALRNTGAETLDVTPLYLAPDGQVFFLTGYEGSQRGGLRLRPNETRSVIYREETASGPDEWPATGAVKLLFFAVIATQDGWPPVDFRFLQTTDARVALRAMPEQSPEQSPPPFLRAAAATIPLTTRPPESELRRDP
ncbi:MAG: caspase family protein [Pseudomonadota bacterium]